MDKILAFVGHSFDESDKNVVRIILDFLTTIKNTGIDFEWDHAEEAQPVAISKKVREKIQGKNLFIGICTKKERVIGDERLKKGSLLNNQKLYALETEFEWKTSDWVLQELGYCLGQNMATILLVENGVRAISGLQADLEYIEFDRANPSLSFQRLLQQISSMNIKAGSSDLQELQQPKTSEPQQDTTIQNEANTEYKTPKPGWSDSEYWIGLFWALREGDKEAERVIYEGNKDRLKDNSFELIAWEGEYLLLKQRINNVPAIESLKELILLNPNHDELHFKLGRAYEEFDSFDHAFEEFNKALCEDNQKWNINYLSKTINALSKTKGKEFAREYLRNNLLKIPNSIKDKYEFLKVYAELFKDDLPNIYCALAEAAIEIKPDDSSLRFDLAYKYSEINLFKQAAFHYRILTQTSPSHSNWNNLGVAYDNLNLHTKSIEAYKESAKLDGTLSMSNMARRLLNSGFADQAIDICNKAMSHKNYDKGVTSTLEAIYKNKESDENAVNELSEETKAQRDFLISFANAFSKPVTSAITARYRHPDCTLDIKIDENKFEAYGIFEKPAGGLSFAAILSNTASDSQKNITYKLSYLGEIYGDAIVAKVMTKYDNQSGMVATILGSGETSKDALIYFSKVENCYFVAEYSESGVQGKPYKIISF